MITQPPSHYPRHHPNRDIPSPSHPKPPPSHPRRQRTPFVSFIQTVREIREISKKATCNETLLHQLLASL